MSATRPERLNPSARSTKLRDRAEAAVRRSRAAIGRMTRKDILRLVDELQVHQIELEMQNEELRQAQSELAHSRDRFNDLYDFAPVGYLTLDHAGTVLEANLTAATMLGVERQKLVGCKFPRFVARVSQDALYLHQRAMFEMEDKQACDLLLRRSDGATFSARMETVCFRAAATGARHCRSALIDITERKQAEEALALSHAELERRVVERTAELHASERAARAVVDGLTAYIAIVEKDGRILAVNERWRDFAPENVGTLISVCEGSNYLAVCDKAARRKSPGAAEVAAGIRAVLAGQSSEFSTEYPCHSTTEERWFIAHVTPFPGEGPRRAVIAHENITARVVAEQALRESEERLRAILNTVGEGIIRIDQRGTITGVNPATERIFGYSAAEMRGQSVGLLMPPSNRAEHQHYLENYLRTGESHVIGTTRETQAQHKDGTVFPIELAVSEIKEKGFFIGVIRDLTLRKQLEAEVLRISEDERQRVAADLHDGICQELVGIQFLSILLLRELEKAGHPVAAKARRVEEAIIGTTEHARQVARGLSPVVADGSGLMYALRQLAETTAGTRRVRCVFDCPEPVSIENPATANELYRIAQEAILNAVRHGRAKRITVRLSESQGEVCLAVMDNGHGLPASASGGDGMGLRIMRYRAALIGGQLNIQPRRRGGTEVICRLVRSSAEP